MTFIEPYLGWGLPRCQVASVSVALTQTIVQLLLVFGTVHT